MIKLDAPIIVEGKYDKIALENVVDGLIIPTDGFGIFKNKEKCDMIRRLSKENGVIIMTDSDSAGSVIRGYIKKIVGECEIYNVYVPGIKGKERRKAKPSKEGLLGVEGISKQELLKALERVGLTNKDSKATKSKISKTDMFEAGLSGSTDSALKRKQVLKALDLPLFLSSNAMLDVLNNLLTVEQFYEVVKRCQENQTKS